MTKIRVVAAVVDTRQLTLYKEDGNTVTIPQGDPRLRKIIDEATPILARNQVATVDLAGENTYGKFEEKTGGLVRFFRVAKSKVASFFGANEDADEPELDTSPVAPTEVGSIPSKARALSAAVDDIMANAVPASHESFSEESKSDTTTMVAVVEHNGQKKVIPGMESLKDQFAYALKLGSTVGVQNFLKRISAVIDQRQHSIHDLLRFMERGDLPIADDGSIIIYKVLRKTPKHHDVAAEGSDIFYDNHSGRVPQRVGSYVCMDPSMVDPNRRHECSNGLHVARRGYLRSFPGDVCVLAKLAPEDVIAVPNYDANKMRVCGYHIIAQVTGEDYQKLVQNKPMTDNAKAQSLLGKAIAGDHIRKIEEVRITQSSGGGVVITPLDVEGQPVRSKSKTPAKAVALDEINAPAGAVDPKAVAKEVVAAKAAVPKTKNQKARELYEAGKLNELVAFKKAAKKGWSALGFDTKEIEGIENWIKNPEPVGASAPATKPAITQEEVAKQEGFVSKITPVVEAVSEANEPVTTPLNRKANSRQQRAREFFNAQQWQHLDNQRRQAKVGWGALGFNQAEIDLIKSKIDIQAPAQDPTPKVTHKAPAKKAVKPATKPAPVPEKTYPETVAGNARKLFDQQKWGPLYDYKLAKKKSWSVLGFTDAETKTILANKPK